jgi:hypothetical protein
MLTGSPSLCGRILAPLIVFSFGIRKTVGVEAGKERACGVVGDCGNVGRVGEVAVRRDRRRLD